MTREAAVAALRKYALYPYALEPDPGAAPAGGTEGGQPGSAGGAPDGRARTFSLSPFGHLAALHGLSSSGDAIVAVALAGSVFFNVSPGTAANRVALSLALTVAPFALIGPLLGPMVERARAGRRAIALSSALGRAVCCFFMALWAHSLLLFPVTFFTLVFSKLYLVTKAALVPGTVERPGQLVAANSKLSVGGSVAGTAAGLVGVGIMNLFDAAGLLRFDIAVYLAAAWAAARLTVPGRLDAVAGQALTPGSPATPGATTPPAAATFPALRGDDVGPRLELPGGSAGATSHGPILGPAAGLPPGGLQLAAVATGALRFSVGFVSFLLVFTFRRHDAALIWYGIALGASQVGNVAGALLAPLLRKNSTEEIMLTAASAVLGTATLAAGVVDWGTHWAVAVLLAGGTGLAAGSGKMAFDSMVQRDVPPRARPRAFARFESGFQLAWAVGSMLAVLVPLSLAEGFIAVGIVGLVGAFCFAGGSVKARRGTLPAWFPGSAPRPGPAQAKTRAG